MKEKGNEVRVLIVLQSGKAIKGTVNIEDYKRFSDFTEAEYQRHIKLYEAFELSEENAEPRFILVPRDSVDWYEPL